MSIQEKLNNAKPTKFFDNDVLNKSIDEQIIVLENALQGALLVPSECAWVSTDVIKICVDTLKCYESWEPLIRHEVEKEAYQQGRTDAIDEFANKMKKLVIKWFDSGVINVADINKIAEELKEQKND